MHGAICECTWGDFGSTKCGEIAFLSTLKTPPLVMTIFNTPPFNSSIYKKIESTWDTIAKPLDGLGDYEGIISRIAAIRGIEHPAINNRSLLIFLSDNGIVEEGVSQSTSEVTRSVAFAMAHGRSTVCVMAREAKVSVIPIDLGIKGGPISGITDKRIADGTRNFLKGPAMTEEETMSAINAGFEAVSLEADKGTDLILLGEMGIGNTTTATAVSCALTGLDPAAFTGRGAGGGKDLIAHKTSVIAQALKKYDFDPKDALRILSLFGGFDIAAMTGAVFAGAKYGIPVVLDGLITLSALLTAETLSPGIKDFIIPSHTPKEPMGRHILTHLDLKAPIDADLALGEGTGGVLLIPQLDLCLALFNEGERFSDLKIKEYHRFA